MSAEVDYTGLLISLTILELFVSGFCLFMVIYLSIRLRKRAWDSPAKRFGQMFNVYFTLTFLFFAALTFLIHVAINRNVNMGYYIAFFLISFIAVSLFYVSFLYVIAIYVALSVQLVAPFLPEKWKVCAQKTHCVKFTEGIIHMLFLLFLIFLPVLVHYYLDYWYIVILVVSGSIPLLLVLLSVFLIFSFAFLMKFFKNHNINNKPIKYMIIKLIFLFSCIAFIITSTIVAFSFYNFILIIVFFYVQIVLYFIFSISVVSLNYPLDILCCIYCFRKSPTCEPSLPVVNATERQLQTNPLSEWDHSNVPSYTVTNLPIEMSDCRSDYV